MISLASQRGSGDVGGDELEEEVAIGTDHQQVDGVPIQRFENVLVSPDIERLDAIGIELEAAVEECRCEVLLGVTELGVVNELERSARFDQSAQLVGRALERDHRLEQVEKRRIRGQLTEALPGAALGVLVEDDGDQRGIFVHSLRYLLVKRVCARRASD